VLTNLWKYMSAPCVFAYMRRLDINIGCSPSLSYLFIYDLLFIYLLLKQSLLLNQEQHWTTLDSQPLQQSASLFPATSGAKIINTRCHSQSFTWVLGTPHTDTSPSQISPPTVKVIFLKFNCWLIDPYFYINKPSPVTCAGNSKYVFLIPL